MASGFTECSALPLGGLEWWLLGQGYCGLSQCLKNTPVYAVLARHRLGEGRQCQPLSQLGKLRPIQGLSLKPHDQLMHSKVWVQVIEAPEEGVGLGIWLIGAAMSLGSHEIHSRRAYPRARGVC